MLRCLQFDTRSRFFNNRSILLLINYKINLLNNIYRFVRGAERVRFVPCLANDSS